MDVGIRTAALWGARDLETDTLYLYAEYYRESAEPSIHAAAIKAKGEWIRGVIDPAANQSTPVDQKKFIDMYRHLGLDVIASKNAVDAGLQEIWAAMVDGRIKVFSSLQKFWHEIRLYRREKGQVVKKNDEIMDCMRYLWLSGRNRMTVKPEKRRYESPKVHSGERSWMA